LDGAVAIEVKLSYSQRDNKLLKQRSKALQLSESYIVASRYTDEPDAILAVDL